MSEPTHQKDAPIRELTKADLVWLHERVKSSRAHDPREVRPYVAVNCDTLEALIVLADRSLSGGEAAPSFPMRASKPSGQDFPNA